MALTILDTGVLIAVLDADDVHHAAARAALATAISRGDGLAVPASVYAESLVAPSRRSQQAVRALDRFLADLPAEVEPITRQVAKHAARLRARHGKRLRLPDAFVLATALHLKADRVLTTDAGWPRSGMTVELVRG